MAFPKVSFNKSFWFEETSYAFLHQLAQFSTARQTLIKNQGLPRDIFEMKTQLKVLNYVSEHSIREP